MSGVVLITGAGGYMGRRLAAHYLEATEVELVLAVRDPGSRHTVSATMGDQARRVSFVCGDLAVSDAFAGLDEARRARITSVVHGAAVTRFNVERAVAQTVNIDGTAQVLDLARRCPALESLVQVSTIYATGLRTGPIDEAPADDTAGFANAYESSKWEAERLVIGAADLPWRVLRLATVIADDPAGGVTQLNALHQTLKLCFYGLLPVLPGNLDTPLYFVTGQFAAKAIAQLVGAPATGIYHVSPDRAGALTLGQVLDVVFEEFGAHGPFRARGILRPPLADEAAFELLARGISPIAGALVAQALSEVTPFAPQMYVDKVVDNSRLRSALGGYDDPDMAAVLAATCRYLVATRWGRSDVEA